MIIAAAMWFFIALCFIWFGDKDSDVAVWAALIISNVYLAGSFL